MTSYPVYMTNLDAQRAVIVGGEPPVQRKAEGLLEAGAQVTLVAPSAPPALETGAENGRLEWRARSYRRGDLSGAALALVTASDPDVRERVWAEAQERNVLINTAGDDDRSTFANGACLRRGPLVVSVSTSGAAPALSVRLRDEIADAVGPEYDTLIALMDALREPMQRHVDDFQTRRDRWYRLVDSNVLDLLRQNRPGDARARIEAIVGPAVAAAVEDWSAALPAS